MAIKAIATITLHAVVDVAAVYRYYKLQSATADVPNKPTVKPSDPLKNAPEGWSVTEPSYSTNSTDKLYTVDLNVFSDDTFDYSAVSLSSSYEAAKAAFNKAMSAENTAGLVKKDVETLTNSSFHSNLSVDGGETMAEYDFQNCLESGNISAGSDISSDTEAPHVRMNDFAKVIEGETYTWQAESGGEAVTPTTWLYTSADGETFTYLNSLNTASITIPTSASYDVYMRASMPADALSDAHMKLSLANIDAYLESNTATVHFGITIALNEYPSYKPDDYTWQLSDKSLQNDLITSLNRLNGDLSEAIKGVEETFLAKNEEVAKNLAAATGDLKETNQKVDKLVGDDGYINIVPEESRIELGKKSGNAKVQITNERISLKSNNVEGAFIGIEKNKGVFGSGSAYITEYHPKVQNTDGSWTGGLVWIARANGHLSLKAVD